MFKMLNDLHIRFKRLPGSTKLMPYLSKKLDLPPEKLSQDLSFMKGFVKDA